MEYNPVSDGASGELTRVIQPHGGWMRWDYRPFTYSGDRSLREVQYRYLAKAAGGAETFYWFAHDDAGDAARSLHYWTVLGDPSGSGKVWAFDCDSGQWTMGLLLNPA